MNRLNYEVERKAGCKFDCENEKSLNTSKQRNDCRYQGYP